MSYFDHWRLPFYDEILTHLSSTPRATSSDT